MGKITNGRYIALILILTIVFMHNILGTSKTLKNIHHINDITFVSHNIMESVFKYKQLHLWTPYYYSGRPLYAQPEYYFLDLNFLYILLFRNIFIAMNLATISYFFLSGLGMYLLFLTFNSDKKGAFISAIIYMFNGYIHSFVISGNLNVLAGYSLIPFAFMFFVKALKSSLIRNSIFSGVFIAFQIFSGGTLLIPYEAVLFFAYSLFFLLGNNPKKKLLRLAFVGITVLIVSFGVSAVKLLPGIEFMKLSNRSSGISYQEYLGEPIKLGNLIHIIVSNKVGEGISASLGIAGFILFLFSILNYKKKYVMFSISVMLISILMSVNWVVAQLFFKIPVFSQLRHIERAVFLIAFAGSILAGLGFTVFSNKVTKKIKTGNIVLKNRIADIVLLAVILLILAELLLLQPFPKSEKVLNPLDIEINSYISKDQSKFRTINLALSTLIGASGYNYLSQLGISEIKGGSGIWFNDYLFHLLIAQQTKPSKLWGVLNNKYVISDRELDINGLKLIGKFRDCKDCVLWEAFGPYLYENLEFMPRAYFTDKGILVIGPGEAAKQVIYTIMLNDNFEPKKSVLIQGKGSVSQYGLDELKKFNAIILPLSDISQNSQNIILKNYADSNGVLIPYAIQDRISLDIDAVEGVLKNLNGTYQEIEIISYENNKASYNAKGKRGFLVLSETFSNFPGWNAKGSVKKEILIANGIITAVYAQNDDKITFIYRPKTFTNGSVITIVSFILLFCYFLYTYAKNKN